MSNLFVEIYIFSRWDYRVRKFLLKKTFDTFPQTLLINSNYCDKMNENKQMGGKKVFGLKKVIRSQGECISFHFI